MLPELIIVTLSLFAVGAGIIVLTQRLYRTEPVKRKGDWIKYSVYLFIILAILLAGYNGPWYLAALLFAIVLGGTAELYHNYKRYSSHALLLSIISGMILTLCLIHLLMRNGDSWFAGFAFLIILVGMTDSFSQLWGKLLGHHKLCPSLSPAKTWEGLVGGFISTSVAAVAMGFLRPGHSRVWLAIIGVIIAVSATAGDLLFSFIKRRLDIKDFSGYLPGHGGILDRFDSLIIAAPAYYWIQKLLIYLKGAPS